MMEETPRLSARGGSAGACTMSLSRRVSPDFVGQAFGAALPVLGPVLVVSPGGPE
jgi:hypothetical protein